MDFLQLYAQTDVDMGIAHHQDTALVTTYGMELLVLLVCICLSRLPERVITIRFSTMYRQSVQEWWWLHRTRSVCLSINLLWCRLYYTYVYRVFLLVLIPLSAVCNPGCINGGECTSPGVCTCNSNWTDATCSTRMLFFLLICTLAYRFLHSCVCSKLST